MNRHLLSLFITAHLPKHTGEGRYPDMDASLSPAPRLRRTSRWHAKVKETPEYPSAPLGMTRGKHTPSLRGATRRGNPDDGSFDRGLCQYAAPHGLPRHLTVPRNDGVGDVSPHSHPCAVIPESRRLIRNLYQHRRPAAQTPDRPPAFRGDGRKETERGSALLAIYLALAAVAVVGVVSVNIMKGPVRTMNTVTQRTLAQNDMIAAQRLAVIAALQQDGGIDCDEDGRVEPLAWAGSVPALGGGTLPPTVGAPRKDPWGTEYGYCVWDHGTQIQTSCTNAANRLRGANGDLSGMAVAMISAGADKVFQTSCADAPNYLNRVSGSDDIVSTHTYAEVAAITGGDTAIAVAGGDDLGNHTATQTLNMAGYIITGLPDPTDAGHAASKAYVDNIVLASSGGGNSGGSGVIHMFTQLNTPPDCPSGWTSLHAGYVAVPFTGTSAGIAGDTLCIGNQISIYGGSSIASYSYIRDGSSNVLRCNVCIKN